MMMMGMGTGAGAKVLRGGRCYIGVEMSRWSQEAGSFGKNLGRIGEEARRETIRYDSPDSKGRRKRDCRIRVPRLKLNGKRCSIILIEMTRLVHARPEQAVKGIGSQ